MSKPNQNDEWSFVLQGVDKTVSLAREIAGAVDKPGVMAFFGGLGSGKTTFIQALGAALGHTGAITSPTYTIINRYDSGRMKFLPARVSCAWSGLTGLTGFCRNRGLKYI